VHRIDPRQFYGNLAEGYSRVCFIQCNLMPYPRERNLFKNSQFILIHRLELIGETGDQ
jgi:hypothetical protein